MKTIRLFPILVVAVSPPLAAQTDTLGERWKTAFLDNIAHDDSLELEEIKKIQSYFEGLPAENIYPFGKSICDALAKGWSIKEILDENFYLFWGEPASNAMYKASTSVICPEWDSRRLSAPD